MPPEPFPWDRRDFRKHERSGSDPRFGGGYGGGGPPRWREQHHANAPLSHPPPYHHHQQQQQRLYSDFRSRPLPPGHGKQSGWHMHPDEAVGFPPYGSRLSDRNIGEENYRPFGSCSDGGRHFRNNRENRGSFSQKYWRATSWEPFSSPNAPGRSAETNDERIIENTLSGTNNNGANNCSESNNSSHPPEFRNTSEHSQSTMENQQGKDAGNAEGLSSMVKIEKENYLGSINWKPLKWSRSGSLSSRGSSLSQSSSSKSMGVDSIETVAEVQQKKVTPIQSPTSDATTGLTIYTPAPSEETSSRKKPRLGWGEGLAKYEKKKIDGPEDNTIKNSMVIRVSNIEENVQSHIVNLLDKSPKFSGVLDCASPATPSSVAFSSSPGIEEKGFIKDANVDHDASNSSCSPSIVSKTPYEGPAFNLENLELLSLTHLSSLISELVQSNYPSSVDAYHVGVNKVLLWKGDITKALERTESEIDSLETELKLLISEPRNGCLLPDPSSAHPGELCLKPCDEQVTANNSTFEPACLRIVSSGDSRVENTSVAVEDEHVRLMAENIDSSCCETSKCVEVSTSGEDLYPYQAAKVLANLDANNSSSSDGNYLDKYLCNGGNRDCAGYHELTVANSCRVILDAYGSILASNKDLANGAAEALNKLLPLKHHSLDFMTKSSVSCLKSDSSVIKKNFLLRKKFLRFKEKALTIKYKLFQHFWIQDEMVSVRKLRAMSHKKFDLIGHKNLRDSRPRISGSAGHSRTVSAEDIMDVVRQLLSDSSFKPYRNNLKMPALILDKKEMQISRFMSNNEIVEDPRAFEKERSIINSWTSEESGIFIDKLATFGKDFSKIASFLDHKTTADCVEFYYKNHKSDCFEKVRKKPDILKQSQSQCITYLVASGKRHSREDAAASLDILGAASAIVATVDAEEICQKSSPKIRFDASDVYKTTRCYDRSLQRSNIPDLYENERETVAAGVLAGICGSLSSEAISSCITSSVDHGDGYHDWRRQGVGSRSKPPFTSEVIHSVDDECSDESCGELDPTDWSDEEKSFFMQALSSYGKDFGMISQCVKTRSRDQCKVFYSKASKCLRLDLIQPGLGIAVSGDVNEGGSDIEDASVLETGSVICIEGLDCKMEEHLLHPDMKSGCDVDNIEGTRHLKPDEEEHVEHSNLGSLDPVDPKPVLKRLLIDNDQCNEGHILDFNRDMNGQNGVDGVSVSVLELGNMVVSSNAETVLGDEVPDECGLPNGLINAGSKGCVEVSDGYHGKDNQEPELFSSVKKVEHIDVNSTNDSGMNCAVSMKSESPPTGKVSHPSLAVGSALQVDDMSGCQVRADLEYSSTENSHVVSLKQNDHSASLRSSTLFSVPIKYQNLSSHNASSPVGVNEVDDGHSQKNVRACACQEHICDNRSSDLESSQILRGYPVSVPIVSEELNSCLICKMPVQLQNTPCPDENLHSDQRAEFSFRKCSSSRHHCEVVEASHPMKEQTIDQSRPQPSYSSDMEKPSSTGDVKLFGKILKSSQQKQFFSGQQKHGNNGQNKKSGCPCLIDSAASKFDCNNTLGSENIPVTKFGFWDENRMQTGLPPLPDSALLLAKYPAAFSNYTRPAAKVEQQALRLMKSNDHTLNGVSMFPSRESCNSNGVTEYIKNREVQPFTIDMKNPREIFLSEMQRRNMLNVVSGMQHQSRGIVGRGGVGGQCSGVSDPVAAIKMHYAKADLFSLQTGNVIKEEDTWRSKGDIGR